MTHRERLEAAWSFREPDRVPIEIRISGDAQKDPRAERLNALIGEHADNFFGVHGYDWGFLGWPATHSGWLAWSCTWRVHCSRVWNADSSVSVTSRTFFSCRSIRDFKSMDALLAV